ncbi:MAG: hypothetical protein KGZ59_12450 [Chitinophagaceae bacterium]|nr:hypothetical protein [Chitinophagaceae bacterium]
MKNIFKLFLIFMLILGSNNSTTAQLKVNVNINVLPDWGPAGYDEVEYYYMPEYEIYYYTPKKQYVYFNGSSWIFVNTLPNRYANINLYSTYKVVINEPRPYLKHRMYKVKYEGYKNGHYKQKLRKDETEKKEKHKHKKEHNNKND